MQLRQLPWLAVLFLIAGCAFDEFDTSLGERNSVSETPQCREDRDCPAEQSCEDGACVSPSEPEAEAGACENVTCSDRGDCRDIADVAACNCEDGFLPTQDGECVAVTPDLELGDLDLSPLEGKPLDIVTIRSSVIREEGEYIAWFDSVPVPPLIVRDGELTLAVPIVKSGRYSVRLEDGASLLTNDTGFTVFELPESNTSQEQAAELIHEEVDRLVSELDATLDLIAEHDPEVLTSENVQTIRDAFAIGSLYAEAAAEDFANLDPEVATIGTAALELSDVFEMLTEISAAVETDKRFDSETVYVLGNTLRRLDTVSMLLGNTKSVLGAVQVLTFGAAFATLNAPAYTLALAMGELVTAIGVVKLVLDVLPTDLQSIRVEAKSSGDSSLRCAAGEESGFDLRGDFVAEKSLTEAGIDLVVMSLDELLDKLLKVPNFDQAKFEYVEKLMKNVNDLVKRHLTSFAASKGIDVLLWFETFTDRLPDIHRNATEAPILLSEYDITVLELTPKGQLLTWLLEQVGISLGLAPLVQVVNETSGAVVVDTDEEKAICVTPGTSEDIIFNAFRFEAKSVAWGLLSYVWKEEVESEPLEVTVRDCDLNCDLDDLGCDACSTEEVQVELTPDSMVTQRVVVDLPDPEAGEVGGDVMFLFDRSGSFDDDLLTFRDQANSIISALRENVLDLRTGLSSFVDAPCLSFGVDYDFGYSLDVPLSFDDSDLVYALNDLDIRSGGDDPESQLEAMVQAMLGTGVMVEGDCAAASIPPSYPGWDPGRLRFLIVSTDADFHLPTEAYYPYPSGISEVVGAATTSGTRIFFLDSGYTDSAALEIAEATGGNVFPLASDSSGVVQAISDAISGVVRAADVSLIPDGDVQGFVYQVIPDRYTGIDLTSQEQIEFDVTFAGTVQPQTEPQEFAFSLRVFINATDIQEIPVVVTVPALE